ncbi:MAG: DNA translocase FtsK, partial [Aeromicrobium sp.]
MATRTSSPPRKRPSGSQARKKKPAARKRPAQRRPAQKRRSAQKRRQARSGPNPITTVVIGFFSLLGAIWLGLAGAVGAVARSIGHSAGDLEKEQRRDGVGFTVLGLAIVV